MVRKRNKRKSRGKSYNSDESEDDIRSESPPPDEPVQKTYSLRKRSRPNFTEDFEYDLEDEECIQKFESEEDEEFVVEDDNHSVLPKLLLEPTEDDEYVNESTYVKKIEPEKTIEEKPDELIDFEDMIRADIVVNSNIIDYDNLIEKSEIKVLQTIQRVEEKPREVNKVIKPPGKKRGRKPKNYIESNEHSVENGHSIFQDLLVPMIESTTNYDSSSSDDLPLAVALRRQSKSEDTIPSAENDKDIAATIIETNIEADKTFEANITVEADKTVEEDKTVEADKIVEADKTDEAGKTAEADKTVVNTVEADKPTEAVNLNGDLDNSFVIKLPQVASVESQGSEDDVVFIEESQPVIVLDDD